MRSSSSWALIWTSGYRTKARIKVLREDPEVSTAAKFVVSSMYLDISNTVPTEVDISY